MTTITRADQQKIETLLDAMPVISVGIGDITSACSMAAINLALTGVLTDAIPACMSEVVGKWLIHIQDAMPDNIRNSECWRSLLPMAAGTGRGAERTRAMLLLDWAQLTVLPCLPSSGDTRVLCANAYPHDPVDVTKHVVDAVMMAQVYFRQACDDYRSGKYFDAASSSARSASAVRVAVAPTGDAVLTAAYWDKVDPCGVLSKLIAVV